MNTLLQPFDKVNKVNKIKKRRGRPPKNEKIEFNVGESTLNFSIDNKSTLNGLQNSVDVIKQGICLTPMMKLNRKKAKYNDKRKELCSSPQSTSSTVDSVYSSYKKKSFYSSSSPIEEIDYKYKFNCNYNFNNDFVKIQRENNLGNVSNDKLSSRHNDKLNSRLNNRVRIKVILNPIGKAIVKTKLIELPIENFSYQYQSPYQSFNRILKDRDPFITGISMNEIINKEFNKFEDSGNFIDSYENNDAKIQLKLILKDLGNT